MLIRKPTKNDPSIEIRKLLSKYILKKVPKQPAKTMLIKLFNFTLGKFNKKVT